MEFWLTFLGLAGVIAAYPYLRCFVKRLICRSKILRLCRKKGYRLHKNHPFWFLGHKNGEKCDFYLETPEKVYAVKLFGLPRRHNVLVFREDGTYFIRHFFYFLPSVGYALDGKPNTIPVYRFRDGYRDAWELKTPHQVLLVHPVSMEIRYQPERGGEVILGAGDVVNGMEITSLSRLLGRWEAAV